MALYRQIAGTSGGDAGRMGLFILPDGSFTGSNLSDIGLNTGLTPVDYTIPIQTLTPSQPIDSGGDTGWINPLFSDPRAVNPDTISLNTTPLLEGPEISPVPTIDPSQPVTPTTAVLPAVNQIAITNNILPLLALAGIIVVAIKGDDLLHEKRKIALLGGLGLLYYGMAKNKL